MYFDPWLLQCSSPVSTGTRGCCPSATPRAWWQERVSRNVLVTMATKNKTVTVKCYGAFKLKYMVDFLFPFWWLVLYLPHKRMFTARQRFNWPFAVDAVFAVVYLFVLSGTAGVIVSLSRIFTKLLVENEKNNTIIFFLFSVSMEALCFLLHLLVRRTHFVRYHTDRAHRGNAWVKGQITVQQRSRYQMHRDASTEDEVMCIFMCGWSAAVFWSVIWFMCVMSC